MKEFNLSDKIIKKYPHIDYVKEMILTKDVKEFIQQLKEEDLYRSLIHRFEKVGLYGLTTVDLIEAIEEYYNEKISKLAGEKLV